MLLMTRQYVAVNESGLRIGECHQRSKFTDHDIELMRQLKEAGLSYAEIADKFETSKHYVKKVCLYLRRNQYSAGWRVVEVS